MCFVDFFYIHYLFHIFLDFEKIVIRFYLSLIEFFRFVSMFIRFYRVLLDVY